jgi:catechol 2,3-dioxygenase-like lactoylglutathione lyase family enzyme
MAARGVHHIGIAVTDLDEAVATYERLFGATLEHRETLEE